MLITRHSWLGHIVFDNDPPASGGGLLPDAQKAFDSRLSRLEGNALNLAQQLFGENFQLREKARSLESRVAPEGAIFLAGADKDAWEAYKLLGDPATVKQGLDERGQFQGELDGLRRETILRRVAEVASYKFSILNDRDKAARGDNRTLDYEIRDVEVDGVKKPAVFVKENGTSQPIEDFARAHWPDYIAVLQVGQGDGQQQTTTPTGTRYPSQNSGSNGSGGGDPVAKFQQRQAEAAAKVKNPLVPSP